MHPITDPTLNHGLLPRYEIRPLSPAHKDWVSPIIMHSYVFVSPLFAVLYPHSKTQRCYDGIRASEYHVMHAINSDLSYGIFDNQYAFRTPAARAAGGKLLWDLTRLDATEEDLLAQMDFPLVSLALAYDSFNPLDIARMGPVMEVLPAFTTLYHALAAAEQRDSSSWQATAPGEVLFRNATSTRREYEGQGLMKRLSWFLMREVKNKGFRGVQIASVSDAVTHVWSNPPDAFRAQIVSEVDTKNFKVENGGKMVRPFEPSQQVCCKIYVTT